MATPTTLSRYLTRLESSLADPHTRSSPYERNRIAANIEHARAMLLTLEKETSTVRVQSSKQATQAELQKSREWIKRLNGRLLEMNSAAHDDDDEDDDDSEKDGVNYNSYGPAISGTEAGLEVRTGTGGLGKAGGDEEEMLRDVQPQQHQQEIRARKQAPSSSSSSNLKPTDNKSAASTTAREQLFAGRNASKTQQSNPSLSNSESLLSHNRVEQETLTSGLLALARSLKESSQQFGASLESEKDILKRAGQGLDKNAAGMEAAEKRMGALRRMSEGQGWWGRIKLYGMIFGLWVACFLLVFLGPRLRF